MILEPLTLSEFFVKFTTHKLFCNPRPSVRISRFEYVFDLTAVMDEGILTKISNRVTWKMSVGLRLFNNQIGIYLTNKVGRYYTHVKKKIRFFQSVPNNVFIEC